MASMSVIGAGAYSGSRLGETTKSTSTRRVYIDCYRVGTTSTNYISGTAWTKTSSVKNTFNPDCKYNGYISVVTSSGNIYANNNNQNANSITCNISGKSNTTVVSSSHVFQSSIYGNYSITF